MAGKGDMNGLWSGWYDYAGLSEPVSFTAWFDETRGILSGTILEPNTFGDPSLDDLHADITGAREGYDVAFIKLYRPDQGAHGQDIRYEGVADSDFNRVRGVWSIDAAESVAGRFELARSSRSISEAILRRVLAPVGAGGGGRGL